MSWERDRQKAVRTIRRVLKTAFEEFTVLRSRRGLPSAATTPQNNAGKPRRTCMCDLGD